MNIPITTVDAFVRTNADQRAAASEHARGPASGWHAAAFSGNPAAVCVLPEARDPAWMLSVAAEMNLSETAFLVRRADGSFDLRWFTPKVEVALCGHATLASSHALWEQGLLAEGEPARFHTKSGLLTATRGASGVIELDFPARPSVAIPTPAGLEEALGEDVIQVRLSADDELVEVASEAVVRRMKPDFARLAAVPVRGVMVTARAEASRDAFDFVSRFFAPRVGIDEDPVTGSAHCCLTPFWAERLGKTELRALQASARGGALDVRLVGDRVKLGGRAITVLTGNLHV